MNSLSRRRHPGIKHCKSATHRWGGTMLNGLSGFSTERWWPGHALLQATSVPAVKMWNAKCEVCSTECHVAIPVQVRDLPVDKRRLRTKLRGQTRTSGTAICHRPLEGAQWWTAHWRAQHWVRMVHRALQLCRPPTGGCSVERLKGDTTLSADGQVRPLSPWLACQPEGRLNMSWWRERKVHTRKSRESDWIRAATASI